MGILAKLAGLKTYLAAAGLCGLSLYQISVGEFSEAAQSLGAAAAAIGLRAAIGKAS